MQIVARDEMNNETVRIALEPNFVNIAPDKNCVIIEP